MTTETTTLVTIATILEKIKIENGEAMSALNLVLSSDSMEPEEKMMEMQKITESRNLTAAAWESVKEILKMMSSAARA